MLPFFRFIENNFVNFFLLSFACAIAWMAYFLRRRTQDKPKFPPLTEVTTLFRERFASGASHHSWKTRMGGASNCLSVTVTDSELWITTFFPFTAFAGFYDLEHRVLHEAIKTISQNGRAVTIDFELPGGDQRRIVLYLRRASEFVALMPPHLVT